MKNTDRRSYSGGEVVAESRKHRVSYLISAVIVPVGLPLLFAPHHLWILGLGLIIAALHTYFLHKSTGWTLYEKELVIRKGYLPWRSTFFAIPVGQIFEAYYRNGFGGHFLKYGTIYIRRTEGSTTTFSESEMTRHREMVTAINERIKNKEVPTVQVASFYPVAGHEPQTIQQSGSQEEPLPRKAEQLGRSLPAR